jgi:hypothetical protein
VPRLDRVHFPILPCLATLGFVAAFSVVPAEAQHGERFELSAMKDVRPSLVKLAASLQKGDVAGSKAALESYETGRRGIELYLGARDKGAYQQFESNLRVKITVGLKAAKPDTSVLAADARTLLAKYDEMVATAAKAPPLNPLYDDVARLRIFRATLREVDLALRAGDFVKARAGLTVFNGRLDTVRDILKTRSPEALDAVTKGTAALDSELKGAKPDATKSMRMIAGMMSKYNVVLNEVSAEVRIQQRTAKP